VNLRRLRRARELSVVELARRAGVSRATLTQLEAGAGNPTLETLYGLATALDAALTELISEPDPVEAPTVVPAGAGARVIGTAVEAWLLHTVRTRGATTEIYDFRLHGAAEQRSAAHAEGTREHLHLFAGRLRVGPVSAPATVGAGDFVTFDAGTEHLYQRVGRATPRGLLVITHDTG
jgi:transcriptional regulator with XRE-family HTH domain